MAPQSEIGRGQTLFSPFPKTKDALKRQAPRATANSSRAVQYFKQQIPQVREGDKTASAFLSGLKRGPKEGIMSGQWGGGG